MRYLVFLLCLAGSLFITNVVVHIRSNERPIGKPIVPRNESRDEAPTAPAPPNTTTHQQWTDLEFQGESSTEYRGFAIRNTIKGLTVSRNGRSRMFLKNNHDGSVYGEFGLRTLLKNGRKQLVYLSTTGGNHCCAEYVIVDLEKSVPRIIFRSSDYGVQMGEAENDALMTFDHENDGQLEITQKADFGMGMDCAVSAYPSIYVGFGYDRSLGRYVPMKNFVPGTEEWLAELKIGIREDNIQLENGKRTETIGCAYESAIAAIALNYVYAGRENEGYEYFLKNYRTLDYRKTPLLFNKTYSRSQAQKSLADMRRTLSYDKLYGKIYNRRVLRPR